MFFFIINIDKKGMVIVKLLKVFFTGVNKNLFFFYKIKFKNISFVLVIDNCQKKDSTS